MSLPAENDDSAGILHGQVAVITGSSGGIGGAIARSFAAAGADVIVHGHTQSNRAEETAHACRNSGRRSMVLIADLSQPPALEAFVARAWEWRQKVDIWVNAAGIDVLTGARANWDFARKLSALWEVDVQGTIFLSRLAGQRMRAAGQGAIVNLGWDQAEQGMAGDSGEMFAAVKGAVAAFTRSLAQSLAPEVRVNCLAPGWIRTQWGTSASEYWQERACRESLRARWGTPEDVARAALFLVAPENDFINGQVLCVNGGFRFGQEGKRHP